MTVRIGKVELIGVQDIHTEETRNLVEQRVPDQKGSVFQDLGRDPVTVVIIGLLFGSEVLSNLEQLRQAQEKADPLPFAADIAIGTELTDVIIEDIKMRQLAGYVDRYRFAIRVREHVEPPESPDKALATVNEGIAADADVFAGDSIAAAGALQDPSNLSSVLADNPGALAQMSADDLAGAVADNVDTLSADNVGEIFKSVGTRDPTKMEGMLTSLKDKGAMGGLLEKFASEDLNLMSVLKGVVSGLVIAVTEGVEFIKRAAKVAASATKLVQDLTRLTRGLSSIIKSSGENAVQDALETQPRATDKEKPGNETILQHASELVDAVTELIKDPAPKRVRDVAQKLKCESAINKAIVSLDELLKQIEIELPKLPGLAVQVNSIAALLGLVPTLLKGCRLLIDTSETQLRSIRIVGPAMTLVNNAMSMVDNVGRNILQNVEAVLGALPDEINVEPLMTSFKDLRMSIEEFNEEIERKNFSTAQTDE